MIAGLAFQVNENYDKITQYYNISKADAGAYGGCYKLAVLMTLLLQRTEWELSLLFSNK